MSDFPQLGVPAWWNHRIRLSPGYCLVARFGVVRPVPADAADGFIRRYLPEQLGQHGRIAHAVVGDFDGPNLQRLGIDGQMDIAPLTPVLGAVFLAFPFPFAQKLDAGAVDQQIQRRAAGPVRQLHLESLLATADGAEVWHRPVQTRQAQQALDQAQTLAQRQIKQAFDAQAKLNGRFAEGALATAFAVGCGQPLHVAVKPDGQ